jgi:pimeloyl-ACP methyl ester carboxylesterase
MDNTRTRDGRRLHQLVQGTGSPTVVFEAGVGAAHDTWCRVQPAVAEVTRTISYDRAGYGRSDRDRTPRTVQRMADDLADLLTADGEREYVLVGHSLGGPIVRWLGYRRPDLVAGLVLVDPVAEDCEVYYRKVRNRCVSAGYRLAALLTASATMRTGGTEIDALAAGLCALLEERVRQGPPGVPVTVISAGRCGPFESKIRPVVVAAHLRLAAGAPCGKHTISYDSGHLIPQHDPVSIITETTRLVRTHPDNLHDHREDCRGDLRP